MNYFPCLAFSKIPEHAALHLETVGLIHYQAIEIVQSCSDI